MSKLDVCHAWAKSSPNRQPQGGISPQRRRARGEGSSQNPPRRPDGEKGGSGAGRRRGEYWSISTSVEVGL